MVVGGRYRATEEKFKIILKKKEWKSYKRAAEAAKVEEKIKRMRYESNKENELNLFEEDMFSEHEETQVFNIPTEKKRNK